MKLLSTLFFLNLFIISLAQVENDNIENRITLTLNSPISSKTDDCTLQHQCLNKDIEKKAITYHNDQWFDFSVKSKKRYYINVSKQNCREIDGVQLIIIDGEPCKPETYRSLGCVSLGTQDDIYLVLDSLEVNHSYLLLVDGYLEDYCQFEIELSDEPSGKPICKKSTVALNNSVSKNIVSYAWMVNDESSNSYLHYETYRRKSVENRFSKIEITPHQKDSYGKNQLVYKSSDTINSTGIYYYEVYACHSTGEKYLLGNFKVNFDEQKVFDKYRNHHLQISRTFKKPTALEILISDAITDNVIISTYIEASRDHQLIYNIKPALDAGTEKVKVSIRNVRKNKVEVKEIDWNQYLKK